MKKIQMTQLGHEKLLKEHDDFIKSRRPKAIERLHTARAMGDLSENSEYTAAKDQLAFVEGRILEIEELLKNVEVVKNHTNGGVVDLGSIVTIVVNGSQDQLQIVGEFEADPMNKKLSSTSPIGKALLNKHVGDNVEIEVPDGKINYKILDIK